MTAIIAKDFKHGNNLQIGEFVIIEAGVTVGDDVKIGHRVTLKSGTRIGNHSIIDDHCITTGACIIGNHVNIRTGAIISKATIIEDYCFIGPGIITNHTKHVNHGRSHKIPDVQLLTYIGYGSILGSQASILAGVIIVPQVIIGGGTVVIKNILERGVYVGCPAGKLSDISSDYLMSEPENAGRMYRSTEMMTHLKTYIPNLKLTESP
ncbi:MAG: hypothetical protein HY881_19855 [Deltaproteobacteria bacterium]|nr:hypothetical protein [Deltaproteobacteria bacterium]